MSRRRRNETEEQRARRELISDFLSAANIQGIFVPFVVFISVLVVQAVVTSFVVTISDGFSVGFVFFS